MHSVDSALRAALRDATRPQPLRDAREKLLAYHWPGNIRELRNIVERAAILCDGALITADHLALPSTAQPSVMSAPVVPAASVQVQPLRDLPAVEREMIQKALSDARFNKSKAARTLGLTRHQLYIRMRRHGLAE